MDLVLRGIQKGLPRVFIKIFFQLGMTAICVRWRRTLKLICFSRMCELLRVLPFQGLIVIRLFGITGRSCTTEKLAIGKLAEKILRT